MLGKVRSTTNDETSYYCMLLSGYLQHVHALRPLSASAHAPNLGHRCCKASAAATNTASVWIRVMSALFESLICAQMIAMHRQLPGCMRPAAPDHGKELPELPGATRR